MLTRAARLEFPQESIRECAIRGVHEYWNRPTRSLGWESPRTALTKGEGIQSQNYDEDNEFIDEGWSSERIVREIIHY